MANNKYPHTTICAECGNVTKIPFIPDGIRPIYYSECLSRQHDDELEVNNTIRILQDLQSEVG